MSAVGRSMTACDVCGYLVNNPARDAISGPLNLPPLIVDGQKFTHAHLGCYRLLRNIVDNGIKLDNDDE